MICPVCGKEEGYSQSCIQPLQREHCLDCDEEFAAEALEEGRCVNCCDTVVVFTDSYCWGSLGEEA